MNNVKAELRMKVDCFSVRGFQPQKVSNREPYVTPPGIPQA
ncbi:MAG: hypothetical protein WBL63_01310 [Candidatus Acidiferrum sp.]